MFEKKKMDMAILKNNYGVVFIIWLLFCTIGSYIFAQLHFDHANFEKSYLVVEELINKDIKKLEK